MEWIFLIKVKKDLQHRVEAFLQAWPVNYTQEEFGGFLFANRLGNISDFIPIPNIHNSRSNTYQMPATAKTIADKYAYVHRGMKVFAEWHSHPSPAICSVQDCRAASCTSLYSVMISPTDKYSRKGREFVWYFYKGIKPERVEFI